MPHLDPTLDIVFRLLFTREPALLRDMVGGVLARPVPTLTVFEREVFGDRARGRRVVFDVHARLDDGARVDLEMQRRITPFLESRLVYYTARDYSDQLCRGDEYHLLRSTTGILWLTRPLFPSLDRLHSVFSLREHVTGARFGDQLAIHVLQLPYLSPSGATGHAATVERWARFLVAKTDAELRQLASEHPIMNLAMQTLEKISQDPDVCRQARVREDELKLYRVELATTRAVGVAEGKAQGKAEILLRLLGQRFGAVSGRLRAWVSTAESEQLDAWADRVLTAATVDEIFAS